MPDLDYWSWWVWPGLLLWSIFRWFCLHFDLRQSRRANCCYYQRTGDYRTNFQQRQIHPTHVLTTATMSSARIAFLSMTVRTCFTMMTPVLQFDRSSLFHHRWVICPDQVGQSIENWRYFLQSLTSCYVLKLFVIHRYRPAKQLKALNLF